VVANTSFVIAKAFVGNEGAKVLHAAGYLTNASATSTGMYLVTGVVSASPANSNETFEFEFYLDTTELLNTESQIRLGATNDYSCATATGIVSYTAGQKLWAKTENLSAANNLMVRNGNMTITSLQ
jgi:hypothetical protein